MACRLVRVAGTDLSDPGGAVLNRHVSGPDLARARLGAGAAGTDRRRALVAGIRRHRGVQPQHQVLDRILPGGFGRGLAGDVAAQVAVASLDLPGSTARRRHGGTELALAAGAWLALLRAGQGGGR